MAEFRLASAGDNIKFWDLRQYSLVKQFNPHSGNVSSISWSSDNSFLASASSIGDKIALTYPNNPAYSYDLATEEEKSCIALNSVSRYVMGGGSDGFIHIWDLKTRKQRMTYKDHKAKVTSIQFNWNDSVIASGSESGEIILFSVTTGISYSPLVVPKSQAVRQVQYSHLKKTLLGSVSDDGAVNLWDTSSKRLLHSFVGSHKAPAMGLAFSPLNQMLLLSVGLDKRIVCYDVVGNCPVKTMSAENPLTSIDLMSDGSTFAVGTTRGKVFIYDLRQGSTPIKTLTAHKSSVQCLRFQSGAKTVQTDVMGKAKSSTSCQSQGDQSVLDDTNAVNNNLLQSSRDLTNGTTLRSSTGLDNQSHDNILSPLSDNINISRGSGNRSTFQSNGPSPMARPCPEDIGFTEEEAKLYGMDSLVHTSSDPELRPGKASATKQEVSSSRDFDHTSADQPVRDRSHSVNQVIHQAHVSEPTENYSTASCHCPPPTSSGEISKKTPAESSSKVVTDTTTKTASRVRSYSNENLKSTDHSKMSPKLNVNDEKSTTTTTPPEAGPSSGIIAGATGSTPHQFPTQFIKNIVKDALEEFRDQIRQDIFNLHSELIKQFFVQQMEIERLVKQHSINDELLAEIQRLREENKQLKKKF